MYLRIPFYIYFRSGRLHFSNKSKSLYPNVTMYSIVYTVVYVLDMTTYICTNIHNNPEITRHSYANPLILPYRAGMNGRSYRTGLYYKGPGLPVGGGGVGELRPGRGGWGGGGPGVCKPRCTSWCLTHLVVTALLVTPELQII